MSLKICIFKCLLKTNIMFKSYTTNDNLLLPPSLGDLIPETDPVRVVDRIIEQIDLSSLYRKYSRLGSHAYHPRLMLKLLIYAYLRNVYSSRRIEDLCRNDIRFLWLNGMDVPDYNTINRFRSGRLKGVLKEVFSTIVKFLSSEGLISLDRVYTDGTKIESVANRYTFVWGKSISTRINKITEQLNELWAYAESVTKQELMEETPLLAEDISADKVARMVDRIDEALRDVDCEKKIKQKVKRVKKAWPEHLKRYEQQVGLLDGRNSYSKTDPDATFMRMKEDHMLNGQLKPAFNVQISTNEQFISNYTLHPTTADTTTYPEHIEDFKSLYGFYPKESIADAGYGSEENYLYAKDKGINTFIKYNYFHKEQTKKWRTDPFRSSNFYYNRTQDCFYCPMGQPMRFIGKRRQHTKTGFEQEIHIYQAIRCQGCPLRSLCHKSKMDRRIEVNHRLNKIKAEEKEKLLSPQGLVHRSQRPQDVEATFGNLKNNKNFKRFLCKGKNKVEVEFGLLAIAHNIAKVAS